MEDALAKSLLDRKNRLAQARNRHVDVWRDCLDYSFPIRNAGFYGVTEDTSAARNKRARLLDSTSTDAARTLASSVIGGITPANSRWFSLDANGSTDEERRWFDDASEKLWKKIHESNYDSVAFEEFIDIVTVGWAPVYIHDDPVFGLTFEQWPIASVYCAASRGGGIVDTVFREYELSLEQCVNEFGIEHVSQGLRTLYKAKGRANTDTKVKVLHAIYPRDERVAGARRARGLPIASVHVEVDGKHVLRQSGYHEMPVIVPRWCVIPGSVYAVGPMFDALPDIKQLNEYHLQESRSADIAVGGMWIAQDDGVLNPRNIRLGGRKIIVANSVDSMKPLLTGANFQFTEAKIEQLQRAIRRTLMADQLQPQDGPAMTATEVHARMRLLRQLLGPVYGRLQSEYLQPLVTRCFGLAQRAGLFEDMPESLQNRSFRIKYISPLAKSQKLEEVSSIESTLASAFHLAQGSPGVLDNFDLDVAIRLICEGNGAPSAIMRTREEVESLRETKQEEEAAATAEAKQAALLDSVLPEMMRKGDGAA